MKVYKQLIEVFSDHLANHVSEVQQKKPIELYGPEAYLLTLGGKRIRPLLVLIGCDLFDTHPSKALDAALSVEFFHNFSLVHDDILDQAPLRRGQPTVHTKWNTNIAILSGDVILVRAFQVLNSYEPQQFQALSNLLSKTAIEVCEGQQLDMNFENLDTVRVDDYIAMITFKTAVLLGCSLQIGSIIAGASPNDQQHLYEFGKHLGISFQLLDDLLDAFATDPEKFGKQTGGDIMANKKTFLLLKAIENANPAQQTEIQSVMAMAKGPEKVTRMLSLFRALNVEQACRTEADKHTQIALQHLSKINADPSKKEHLKQFAIDLLNRDL